MANMMSRWMDEYTDISSEIPLADFIYEKKAILGGINVPLTHFIWPSHSVLTAHMSSGTVKVTYQRLTRL